MTSTLIEDGSDREDADPPRSPILLVDDREENLLTLEAVVEPLGHPIIKATSGKEALRVLLREDVAVILLDVQMPELDGFETAAHIKQRERTRQIPIIFLTAISADTGNVLRGYAQGAVDYLTKPFDPDVLRSKVAVFLELHRSRTLLQDQANLLEVRLREREVAERALQATAADLARSNSELEQFAAVVAHDLQAPLVTNAGLIAALLEDYGDTMEPEAVDLLLRVDRNRESMRQLVRSLLAWSQASLAPMGHALVDLEAVLHDVLEACGAVIGVEHADIRIGALPQVTGDPSQLGELFQNLLTNAVKFHRPGVNPSIEISASKDADGVTVAVADDGVGIDPDRRDEVFSMFSRLGSKQPGRGIGLAVCHRIVERHGGRIWMDGREGGGNVANVWLPGPA